MVRYVDVKVNNGVLIYYTYDELSLHTEYMISHLVKRHLFDAKSYSMVSCEIY